MPLPPGTKLEIQQAVKQAFSEIEIPTPEGCLVESGRIGTLEKLVQSHDIFIDGNGNEGAKTTIPLIKQLMNKLAKDFYEFRDKIEARIWAITLLVLGTLITSILNLVIKSK